MSESPNPALALLEFERRIQSATSNREVAFRAVNDASQVLDFDQAVLWRIDVFSRPLIAVASGLADVSGDSPYQQWLVQLVQAITPADFQESRAYAIGELPEAVVTDGADWCPAHLLHCPLRGPTGSPLGGILFFRGGRSPRPSRPAPTGSRARPATACGRGAAVATASTAGSKAARPGAPWRSLPWWSLSPA